MVEKSTLQKNKLIYLGLLCLKKIENSTPYLDEILKNHNLIYFASIKNIMILCCEFLILMKSPCILLYVARTKRKNFTAFDSSSKKDSSVGSVHTTQQKQNTFHGNIDRGK